MVENSELAKLNFVPLKVDNDDLVSSFFDATTKSFLIVFRTICGNSGRLSSRRCWSSETERFFPL